MADKYITCLGSILLGFEMLSEGNSLENCYRGVNTGDVRVYDGPGFGAAVSHADEKALMFLESQEKFIVVLAPAEKALLMKEVCDAEGVACHYEIRGKRVIFRCFYDSYGSTRTDLDLIHLLNGDNKDETEPTENEVVFYAATSESGDESDNENGLEPGSGSGENSKLNFGDLSVFPD